MGNLNKIVLAVAFSLLAGYSIGRYIQPPKVEEKIVTQNETKENKNVYEVTRTIEHADGTKETIKETTDLSSSDTKSSVVVDKKTTTRPDWKASVGLGLNTASLEQFYIVHIDRRILGGLSVGAFGTTSKEVGITVGLEF